jgi:hypothetical protein
LPAPYAGLRFAGLAHDLDSPDAIGTQSPSENFLISNIVFAT